VVIAAIIRSAAGAVPEGVTVFDDEIPGVANLDPARLGALRQAATDAAVGDAVDVGHFDVTARLSEHGAEYGLCQIYRYPRSKDAAVTSTLGIELVSTQSPHARGNMSRKLRPLAALAMVALISAGCSHAPAETGSSGGNKNAATYEQAVKFAKCRRDNGVREFPDPDASGQLTIDGIVNGSSIDPDSAAFKQAISACKDLEPPGFTGYKRSAQQQEAALKFAQCIRDNGVKDFPDPDPDGPLVDTNRIPSANRNGGMSILRAAMEKCGDFAAAAGVTGGR
jgi:hypothetical protein